VLDFVECRRTLTIPCLLSPLVRCTTRSLSGLVAITAGCGVVDYWASVLIGMVAGWVYMLGDYALIRFQMDDAVSAIPVHLGNGLWGIVAVGLWARPSLLEAAYGMNSHPGLFFATEGSNLLPAQLVGGLFILGWTAVTMLPFFVALDYFKWFRVNELEEFIGLDAMYSNNGTNMHLCDEDSSTNEELRRMAYSQRLAEKQEKKQTGKPSRKMTLSELLTISAYGTAPSEEWLKNKKSKSKSKRKGGEAATRPEQAAVSPQRSKRQASDQRNKEQPSAPADDESLV
jgi:Ammonium Transporter Family